MALLAHRLHRVKACCDDRRRRHVSLGTRRRSRCLTGWPIRGRNRELLRRVTVIVGVWLGLLLAAVAGYVQVEGDAAVARGLDRYVYRESLKRQLARTSGTPPDVVWLGDSTMLGLIRPSYPQLLGGVLPDVPSRVIGFLGADFYTYYPCVGALLAVHHPAVLVLVAHLRLFRHPSEDPTGMSTT